MPEQSKRKKHHDKDKYYRLAKEQGLRSRAAFKLSQINRKYHLLEKAKVVLDLCAAPGGWSQIASRSMASSSNKNKRGGSSGGVVIAVDILPIRPISRDVITIIGDITTEECRASIRREMQNHKCDLVLSDGAPNVGFDYMRDAYEQNEIALLSLRCATEHLKLNGSFICKVYRSSDYTAFLWVVKQLFKEVDAVKPSSSRSQSSEIFLVCQGYRAPTSIDPRMLDPKSVFEHEEAGTGATSAGDNKNVNIFHKKFNEQKRFRQGYDFNKLDSTFRNIQPISSFIDCSDPVQFLTDCTAFSFVDDEKENEENTKSRVSCKTYLDHPATTVEIKECCTDLKVLGRSDFKGLLTWRLKMIEYKRKIIQDEKRGVNGHLNDKADELSDADSDDESQGSSEEEEEIQAEITALKEARLRKKKKEKKKEREAMAKIRRRKALGMDLQAIDLPDHDKVFSLATITNKEDLEKIHDVNLSTVDDEIFQDSDDESGIHIDVKESGGTDNEGYDSTGDVDDETGYSYRLDKELDAAYDTFLKNTKNSSAKAGTKMAKRSKKQLRLKAAEEASEDLELTNMNDDTKAYAKLLTRKDSDDDDDPNERETDDESEDGFHADPETPKEHAKRITMIKEAAKNEDKSHNPLIHKIEEKDSIVAARWFSNPLFESIGNTAQSASLNSFKKSSTLDEAGYSSDEMKLDSDDDEGNNKSSRESIKRGIDVDDVLAEIPKTDKQKRHERRMKAQEREERRKAKKARIAGLEEENTEGFEVVQNFEDSDDEKLDEMDEKAKKKELERRALIKAGMGNSKQEAVDTGYEVVSKTLPVIDNRKYDSENEDYDSDDHAQTLALGTMMLRRSKAKELVDASYNRFAWNDPSDLPEWFVDDENKNYRPQLPIPPELLAKMKEKFLTLASKPIKKVAEARARKKKRVATKLAAAKKKAASVANSSDMTETMKLKAISKAMRSSSSDGPRKKTVVARKGSKAKGGRGIKLVDRRLKNDTRSMKRAEKKKGGSKRKR